MENSAESSEKGCKFQRFDDLVRTERYFTATLLPSLLFHNNLDGARRFVELVDKNAKTERDSFGAPLPMREESSREYNNFEDLEVIAEFHIAQDLKFAGLLPRKVNGAASEEVEREHHDALDVVIAAGRELVVCEGKFFLFFSDSDADDLNGQLKSQRRQMHHLFLNRPSIRAYRHVAILPFKPTTIHVDADVVLTWDDIGNLAENLMRPSHYVTVRLRKAVEMALSRCL